MSMSTEELLLVEHMLSRMFPRLCVEAGLRPPRDTHGYTVVGSPACPNSLRVSWVPSEAEAEVHVDVLIDLVYESFEQTSVTLPGYITGLLQACSPVFRDKVDPYRLCMVYALPDPKTHYRRKEQVNDQHFRLVGGSPGLAHGSELHLCLDMPTGFIHAIWWLLSIGVEEAFVHDLQLANDPAQLRDEVLRAWHFHDHDPEEEA